MKSKEIRSAFLEYFRKKGHTIVKSSPLIPKNDPTLLFTNAGMVQFKSVFLGDERSDYKRAVSCQKCMRAGGKHSDIENVGFTSRHHTFFEMLGNFSFGDYFKRDAIFFAWDLFTEWLKLPVDKLWISVYEDDEEAATFWNDLTGIKKDRIVRLGAKGNFWQMGDTGPCGPCSEILIDQGESVSCGREDCAVGCDCDRYLELWNLVFMQYNRDEKGILTPLPEPSIDTGMGIERIAAVCQKKLNNFDSDLFILIIEAITSITNTSYGKDKTIDSSIRVIADHIRAITFLLSEGLIPSNEERGYVLRRIIRRASRHTKKLGVDRSILYKLIESASESIGDIYPEILIDIKRSEEILKYEEERFLKTLENGLILLEEIMDTYKKSEKKIIPGSEIFKLYDTYGFPTDITEEIVNENNMGIDWTGFYEEMEAQKSKGKLKATMTSAKFQTSDKTKIYFDIFSETGQTEFLGYKYIETESIILFLTKDNLKVNELKEGEEGDIILDKTPFYGESGGQVGDTGTISSEKAIIDVKNTTKTTDNLFIHHVKVKKGIVNVSDIVLCKVDEKSRNATMRNHTATHLLHAALRDVLGDHVKQSGSLVEPQRLRFDFNHFYPVSNEEKNKIEDIVNDKILENLPVTTHIMDVDEAIKTEAIALFDEKYGDMVRVIKVDNYSKELCGGTHCHSTGEIGTFIIVSEGSIASGVRRIEALTGVKAFDYLRKKSDEIKTISESLKTDKTLEKVISLNKKIKELEKEIEQIKFKSITQDVSDLLKSAITVDGIKILVTRNDGLSKKELREFADKLRDRLDSGIIFVASVTDGQSSFISMVTNDLIDKLNAGSIVKEVAAISDGKGGGRADMAQGGTKSIDKLDFALNKVYEIVKSKL